MHCLQACACTMPTEILQAGVVKELSERVHVNAAHFKQILL